MKILRLNKNIVAIVGTLTLSTSTLFISAPAHAVTGSETQSDLNAAKQNESKAAREVKNLEAAILAAHDKLAAAYGESMKANNAYSEALVVSNYKSEEHDKAMEALGKSREKLNSAKEEAKKIAVNNYKNMGSANPTQLDFINLDPASLTDTALSQAVEDRNVQRFQSALQASNAAKNLEENAEDTKKAADAAKAKAANAKTAAETAQKEQQKLIATAEQERESLIKKLAELKNSTVEIEKRHAAELERKKEEQYLKDLETRAPQQPGTPALEVPSQPHVPEVTPPPARPNPPAENPQPPAVGGYQQIVLSFMRARLGQPYEWGGTGPWGYDCSGLTLAAFSAAGIGLPRVAHAQFMAAPVKVPLSQMQPGDLLVWGPPSYFTHIAVYLGDGKVIHAFNPTDGITITPLSWMSHMGLYPQAARF